MRLRLTGAAALVAACAAAVAACTPGQARTGPGLEDAAPLPVAVVNPRLADIEARYMATGTITADSEASVPARTEGDVVEILVEEGDRVAKRQILARLDGEKARLEARRARADYERALREYERLAGLHQRGLVSLAAYESLQYDVQARLAAYRLAELDYEYTFIRSTIDGVVSSRAVKVGSRVGADETAFVITDTRRLVAYLDIPQTEMAKFSTGQAASVTVDSDPGMRFTAAVARISPTIDASTGTFRATLALDDGDGRLAPGMFGRFTIAYETHSDAIVIPSSAAVREDGEVIVFVVEDGEARRRSVETGIEADGMIEVTGGLSARETVVLSGQTRLRDGSRVLARAAPFAGGIRG